VGWRRRTTRDDDKIGPLMITKLVMSGLLLPMLLPSCSHDPCSGVPLTAVSESAADVATSCPPGVAFDGRVYYLADLGCVRPSLVGVLLATSKYGQAVWRARSIDGVSVEDAIAVSAGPGGIPECGRWDFFSNRELGADEARTIGEGVTMPIPSPTGKAATPHAA
jgi:hypothetical protein